MFRNLNANCDEQTQTDEQTDGQTDGRTCDHHIPTLGGITTQFISVNCVLQLKNNR